MDVQWSVLLARYGEHWRFRRKIVERSFRPGSLSTYRVIQETRARGLATRLLQSPQEWITHIELSVFSLFVHIAFLNHTYHFLASKANNCLP